MESLHSTADIIRKVALFTVVGFLVVFLIGPVLTLLGVVITVTSVVAVVSFINGLNSYVAEKIFNLGADEYCTVDQSLTWICDELGVQPKRVYVGGERGWIGDSPFIFLDCSRIRALGWQPKLTIREGIIRTVQFLQENSAILDARS